MPPVIVVDAAPEVSRAIPKSATFTDLVREDHQVRRLDVAVDDAPLVREVERLRHRPRPPRPRARSAAGRRARSRRRRSPLRRTPSPGSSDRRRARRRTSVTMPGGAARPPPAPRARRSPLWHPAPRRPGRASVSAGSPSARRSGGSSGRAPGRRMPVRATPTCRERLVAADRAHRGPARPSSAGTDRLVDVVGRRASERRRSAARRGGLASVSSAIGSFDLAEPLRTRVASAASGASAR